MNRRQLDRHFLPYLAGAGRSRLFSAYIESVAWFVVVSMMASLVVDSSTSVVVGCIALTISAIARYLFWVTPARFIDFTRHKIFRIRQRHIVDHVESRQLEMPFEIYHGLRQKRRKDHST